MTSYSIKLTYKSGLIKGISDSIVAWVDNAKKFIRVSDGEWIMKQKAVNYYGSNIMAAINRGMIPRKILDTHAKYAEGGSIPGLIPSTGIAGMYGLTADLTASTPNVNIVNRIDGNGIVSALESMINSRVSHQVERNMIEKGKFFSQLNKRFR